MKKEFIQTFRDRRMVMIIFVAPLIQLFIIGYAISTDVKDIRIGVLDECRSESSRRVVEAFSSSGYFRFAGSLDGKNAAVDALYRGDVDAALIIPTDYERSLLRGEKAELQLLFDASDSNFAQIAGSYAQRIITSLATKSLQDQMTRIRSLAVMQGRIVSAGVPQVSSAMRVWYNPELKSVYYMVPGIISMILMIITMMLTGMAVTRERELGTIEQVIISPIAGWEFILGKLLPFGILGFIDVALIVAVGIFHFRVPMNGSLLLLFFSSGLFLFTTLGLGLFFSTISSTQQQAMFVNFMFMMPAILLSGFMFPIANMPDAVQYLTYLNPQRYFLVILRGLFLKGNGIDILWPQLVALAGLGIAIFAVAALRFRRILE